MSSNEIITGADIKANTIAKPEIQPYILIIGGSGSLGKMLIKDYLLKNYNIINYSRDENKHWFIENELKEFIKNKQVINIIGDISDEIKLRTTILQYMPSIIIIASAMKHIDRCEIDFHSSIKNNVLGVEHIYNICITYNNIIRTFLKTICYISTDKACNPISTYGLCKGLSEKIIQNLAQTLSSMNILTKCICVRYGNVLNSRGSIIEIIKNKLFKGESLVLTHPRMTRFIMTLQQSVDLINYAIEYANSGDIVVRDVPSMLISDLLELYTEQYNIEHMTSLNIQHGSIRFIEKIHEELINDTQSMFTIKHGDYYHITSPLTSTPCSQNIFTLSSDKSLITKLNLKLLLQTNNLL